MANAILISENIILSLFMLSQKHELHVLISSRYNGLASGGVPVWSMRCQGLAISRAGTEIYLRII